MIAKKESTLISNMRQRQSVTEELKRSDAFSPTTFKNTPKTIIPSNSNSVQISVYQYILQTHKKIQKIQWGGVELPNLQWPHGNKLVAYNWMH